MLRMLAKVDDSIRYSAVRVEETVAARAGCILAFDQANVIANRNANLTYEG